MEKNKSGRKALGTVQLTGAAFIWGVAFVAQSVGNSYMGPFAFGFVRSLLAVITIAVLINVFDLIHSMKRKNNSPVGNRGWSRVTLQAGIICGTFLGIAATLQQIGLNYTTVGKAGFITAMYIVLVPVVRMFTGKPAGKQVWAGVFLGVAGLYLLGVYGSGETGLNPGDLMMLGSALCFTFQIIAIDNFVDRVDGLKLSLLQFTVYGLISLPLMLLFEQPDPHAIVEGWIPVLYMGVMSSGVAYTLQIMGQGKLNPTVGCLLMSLESVVSAVSGWFLLGEKLSVAETAGCVIMGAAIVIAQLPDRVKDPAEKM